MKHLLYFLLPLLLLSCNNIENKSEKTKEKMNSLNINNLTQILENSNKFDETTLSQLPNWPTEMQIEGDLRHWQKVVYKGEQIVGAVWKSKAGKLQIDNYPYEQMVLVLEGTVTLQPKKKEAKTYKKGDIFFVPKGFEGTWEMKSDYKELIVVEREAWIKIEGE